MRQTQSNILPRLLTLEPLSLSVVKLEGTLSAIVTPGLTCLLVALDDAEK